MGWVDALGIRTIPVVTGQNKRAVDKVLPRRVGARRYWKADVAADEPEDELAAFFDTKAGVMGISDALAAVLSLSESGSYQSPGPAIRAYEQSSAVSIPINLIAEHAGATRLVLTNLDSGDVERRSPVLDLLRRPHPSTQGSLFIEFLMKMFLITGEAPIVAIGNSRFEPIGLRALNPQDISPIPDEEYGWARSWHVEGPTLRGDYTSDPKDQGSVWRSGPLRELRVIRSFSTRDASMLRGQSKLVSASMDVRQQIEGAKFNIAILTNGGRPSLIVSTKNHLGPQQFDEFKRRLKEDFEGAKNAGKFMVTNGGELDVKEAKASVREMEYSEGQSRTAQTIAKVYKVPIVLLNMDAATFSNMETATLALWDDAILPTANYVLGDLSDWLLPKFGMDPSEWRIALDESQINALRARRYKEWKDRASSGLEAPNEIRKEMPGLEPKEGGDEILVSSALSPMSLVGAEVDDLLEPPEPTDDDPATPASGGK